MVSQMTCSRLDWIEHEQLAATRAASVCPAQPAAQTECAMAIMTSSIVAASALGCALLVQKACEPPAVTKQAMSDLYVHACSCPGIDAKPMSTYAVPCEIQEACKPCGKTGCWLSTCNAFGQLSDCLLVNAHGVCYLSQKRVPLRSSRAALWTAFSVQDLHKMFKLAWAMH